jgi:osmotically-inducible protein OsmY
LPPPLLATPPAPAPAPSPGAGKGPAPAVIAVVIALVLALGGVAYGVMQSGGSNHAASPTTTSSSSPDSTTTTDPSTDSSSTFPTKDDARIQAEFVMGEFFTLDFNNVQDVFDELQSNATGAFLDQLTSVRSDYAASVQSDQAESFGSATAGSIVASPDGQTFNALVTVDVFTSLHGNTDSTNSTVTLLVTLTNVNDELLVSNVVTCTFTSSDGVLSEFSSPSSDSC